MIAIIQRHLDEVSCSLTLLLSFISTIESVEPARLSLYEFTLVVEPKDGHYCSFFNLRSKDSRVIIRLICISPCGEVIIRDLDVDQHQLWRKANEAGCSRRKAGCSRFRVHGTCNFSVNHHYDQDWVCLRINHGRKSYEFFSARL